MLLFIISFFLVMISSYFITSMIAPKNSVLGLIYMFVISFAQIVMCFELLSLISCINLFGVLAMNILFCCGALFVWKKRSCLLWKMDCSSFKTRVANSLKLDKALLWLYFGWCVFIISAVFLCALMPVTNADADGYHVVRSLFWISQGNLNHFMTADIRALCLPINSELLYTWIFLFIKKDAFLGFFGFCGYILSMISVYNILGLIRFSTRRKLWIVFILSSFASVLVQASGTETDIILAGLITSSIFLFWYALKNDKLAPIYISALAYALAIGTKTTSILAIPAVGLFFIALCAHYKKFKPLGQFLGYGIINFIVFSSYNYILNFLDFSNLFSSQYFMTVSNNYYGIKGMFANFIKHMFMFFDFTGLTWSVFFGPTIASWKMAILTLLHLNTIPDGLYTFNFANKINNYLLEPLMGPGVLGIFVYFPCLIGALLKPLFKFKSEKVRFLFGFAGVFFLNVLVMSYFLSYMAYNARFIMMFMVISAPILAYSYFRKKNIFKNIIVFFALFYLIFVSTNLWPRGMSKIVKLMARGASATEVRYRAVCQDFDPLTMYRNAECLLSLRIQKQFDKKNNILIFVSSGQDMMILKKLEFDGYHIDFGNLEDAYKIDYSKYNIIIPTKAAQQTTNISHFESKKNALDYVNGKMVPANYDPVPCFYLFNPRIPRYVKTGELVSPYCAYCAMTKDFIEANKFKLVGTLGYKSLFEKNTDIEYKLYENVNNPILWKK